MDISQEHNALGQNPHLHSPQASADISQEHNALGQTTSLHSRQASAATGHEHLGQNAQAYAPSAEGLGRGLASRESQARSAPRRPFQLPAYQAGPPEGPLAPPRIGPHGEVYMDRREVMFGLSGRMSSPQQVSNCEMFMTQDLTRGAVFSWGPQPSQAPQDQTDDRPRPAKRQRRNPGSNIDAGKNKRKRDDSALN